MPSDSQTCAKNTGSKLPAKMKNWLTPLKLQRTAKREQVVIAGQAINKNDSLRKVEKTNFTT